MKELRIGERQAGQRLDKYLAKLLDQAPKSFLYKMLRKKNIVLNGKKASGNEILQKEDLVKIYFKDETFARFCSSNGPDGQTRTPALADDGRTRLREDQVLYEDEHILVINKPAGILSQKARPEDDSINEQAIRYLLQKGSLTPEDLVDFTPSIANRLDRNTSGVITMGKTVHGLQMLGQCFHDHTAGKQYICLVCGSLAGEGQLTGYLQKDQSANRVSIRSAQAQRARQASQTTRQAAQTPRQAAEMQKGKKQKNQKPVMLRYRSIAVYGGYTLLEVELLTGRTHQIRAQLADAGYPILGDPKYGDPEKNRIWRQTTGLRRQLLHARELTLPDGIRIQAPVPADFQAVLDKLQA